MRKGSRSSRLLEVLYSACLVGFITLILLFTTIDSPPRARGATSICSGLDVVFLLDQSTSMEANDEHKVRSNTVRTVLDILGDNAVYFCPGIQHRIAVVGFGDALNGASDTNTYLTSTIVSPTLDGLNVWHQEKRVLKERVPLTDSLGGTDYASAFDAALPILNDWRSNQIGNVPRKRLVIMVTDGSPCVFDLGCDNRARGPFNISGYMDSLESKLDPLGRDFPWRGADNLESIHIWLIALLQRTDQDNSTYSFLEDPNVGPAWKRITTQHGGDIKVPEGSDLATLNADLTSVVANIIDPFLGSQLPQVDCTKPFWVDPYVSNVTVLHVFHRGANPGVPLENVEVRIRAMRGERTVAVFSRGSVIEGNGQVTDYTADGPNERYVFYQPPPGKYTVEVTGADVCKHLDIRRGQTNVIAEVLTPAQNAIFQEVDKPPYYDTAAPVTFRMRMLRVGATNQHEPLQEEPDFPLDIQAVLRAGPDVTSPFSQTFNLRLVDRTQAIYEARTSGDKTYYIDMHQPGSYHWELKATTRNPRSDEAEDADNTPIEIFRTSGGFRIEPMMRRFHFGITKPRSGETFLLDDVQGKPLEVEVQVLDTHGEPLGLAIASPEEQSRLFTAILTDEAGKELNRQPLLPREPIVNSIYTATFMGSSAGGSGFYAGCYQIVAELNQTFQSEVFIPESNNLTAIKVCMQPVRYFTLHLKQPISGTHPIHPTLQWFPPPLSRPIVVEISDANGTSLLITDVLELDASTPIRGKVVNSGNNRMHDLIFHPGDQPDQLVADWPSDADERGNYEVEIEPIITNLSPVWRLLSNDKLTNTIRLEDTLFSRPWSLLALVVGLSLLAITLVLLYFSKGPLFGAVLAYGTRNNGADIVDAADEVELYGRFNRRRYTVRRDQLDRSMPVFNLEKIVVRPTQPATPRSRFAVLLTLLWQKGEEQASDEQNESYVISMDEGDYTTLGQGQLVLRRKRTNWLRETLWLVLLILLAFGSWIVVFGYLYLNS